MHKEILSQEQLSLLSLVKEFKTNYYLVGGTAIALYLGHRKSIDFDLFSTKPISHTRIIATIKKYGYSITKTLIKNENELTIIIDGVKFTFLYFPFNINGTVSILPGVKSLELIELGALKAYAIGRRSKWKDYVDMYLLLKNHFSISQISLKADEIFSGAFNEKIFREQLCYFEDIDYTEEVDYIGINQNQENIKDYLLKIATV
ncbi:MAG: nucleotidyl transferase AbiEii/AbiGii toxin family protein [Candidatus Gracilibacteria bacterium]|nr:nucleotidyl transferase AbiEii/AbiGii toxin family protein [Candidatus Gracilibacteria bacterium]MDD2908650.1 nucleotidyl transferase AbiEii/AbiGii toxin family protein [Candidatus Gracilibacteria bacterium]